MRKHLTPSSFFVLSTLLIGSQAALVACGSDDDDVPPATDGGSDGSTDASLHPDAAPSTDASTTDARADSGSDATFGSDTGTGDSSAPDSSPGDAGDASPSSDAGDAGSAWTLETVPDTQGAYGLYAVTGTSPTDVYVSGVDGIWHSTGDGTWTQELKTAGLPILSLTDDGTGHVFAANLYNEIYSRAADGTWSFTQTSPVCGKSTYRGGLVFARGTAFYEAQNTSLCVGTLTNPTATSSTSSLGDVVAFAGTTQTFAVGSAPTADASTASFAAFFDGAGWETLAAVGGQPGYTDVVAAGTSALIIGTDGLYLSTAHGAPSTIYTSAATTFGHAWGETVTEAWIIQDGTGVAHFTDGNATANGAVVASESLPTLPGQLFDIWGTGTGELYAVGDKGTLVHKK